MPTSSFRLPGGFQSAPTFKLIRSQNFRQQLGKHIVKPLPGRDWEMGTFACSFYTEPRGDSNREYLCATKQLLLCLLLSCDL